MSSRRSVFAVLGVAVVLAFMFWWPGSAGAIHELEIEFGVIRDAPGSLHTVATHEVEPWLQGQSCAIHIEVTNNPSVHPGTELIISSGDDVVTVSDVESEPGTIVVQEGELVLGETVVAAVRLGPDGVTSGGFSVDFVCPEEPPTTVTPTTAPPTTAPPPTVAPETPTPTAPPATVPPPTVQPSVELPPSQPEPPTAAQPSFTG
jgi:hypothetical protein